MDLESEIGNCKSQGSLNRPDGYLLPLRGEGGRGAVVGGQFSGTRRFEISDLKFESTESQRDTSSGLKVTEESKHRPRVCWQTPHPDPAPEETVRASVEIHRGRGDLNSLVRDINCSGHDVGTS